MVRAAAPPARTDAVSTEINFHAGSVRVGVIRLGDDSVAYVQTGDVHKFALRPIWEVPTTVLLPVERLPTLASALGQMMTVIRRLLDK